MGIFILNTAKNQHKFTARNYTTKTIPLAKIFAVKFFVVAKIDDNDMHDIIIAVY